MGSGSSLTGDTYNDMAIVYNAGTGSTNSSRNIGSWTTDFTIEPSTYYTISFWAKGSGTITTYFSSVVASGSNDSGNSTTSSDGAITTTLNSNWTRHWITYKTLSTVTSSTTATVIPGRCANNSTCYMCGVKLEYGTLGSDWDFSAEEINTTLTSCVKVPTTGSSVGSFYQHTCYVDSDGYIQEGGDYAFTRSTYTTSSAPVYTFTATLGGGTTFLALISVGSELSFIYITVFEFDSTDDQGTYNLNTSAFSDQGMDVYTINTDNHSPSSWYSYSVKGLGSTSDKISIKIKPTSACRIRILCISPITNMSESKTSS